MKLSFAIQGPIYTVKGDNKTLRLIESIKLFFPSSQIIFSTWGTENITNISCDKIIINKDPGIIESKSKQKWFDNINRQIISSKNAILNSDGDIVVKIRSDLELVNDNINIIINNNINQLKGRKVICWGKTIPFLYPFYLPDFLHIGSKEMLLKIWDIDLATEFDANYFYILENKYKFYRYNPFYFNIKNSFSRLHPEQYIYLNGIGKNVKYENHLIPISNNLRVEFFKLILNNFIFYGSFELGIKSNKHDIRKLNDRYVSFFYTIYLFSFNSKFFKYIFIYIIYFINLIRQIKGEIKNSFL